LDHLGSSLSRDGHLSLVKGSLYLLWSGYFPSVPRVSLNVSERGSHLGVAVKEKTDQVAKLKAVMDGWPVACYYLPILIEFLISDQLV
jgi:hypothetical protein